MLSTRVLPRLFLFMLICAAAAPAQFGLPTSFAGGNGQDGNMFDVQAARDVLITGFDVNADPTTAVIEVYAVTAGTSFIGSETNSADWTLIDTVQVLPNGNGEPTQVALSDGIFVAAGQTLGIYVTAANLVGGLDYTTGSDFGGVSAQDHSLTVFEGVGKSYPFGSTFGGPTPGGASRIWNGRVRYDVVTSATTNFTGGTALNGNMFDIVATDTIILREIEMHLGVGSLDVEVYVTNFGSFVGKETTPGDWMLIGSTTVTGAGINTPTTVPLLFDIPITGTRGVYVTCANSLVRYTVSNDFGAAAYDDGTLQIQEGIAISHPFGSVAGSTVPGGSSRIWNGTLRYSLPPVSSIDEDFDGTPGAGSDTTPRGWLQDLNDASGILGDWYFRDDTPSSLNGPLMDNTTGTGNFAYTEDTAPSDYPAVNLLTPPVFIDDNASLVFWVNSNDAGASQNPLAVDVIEQPSGEVHRDIVLTIGETGGNWTRFRACLTPFMGGHVQVRFRGRTDGGSFDNDVGLDDVSIGVFTGPQGLGQAPQPGLATLDINDSGERSECAPVSSNLPGPYRAITHPEDGLDISIGSEPSVPVLFFAGPTNANLLDLGPIGKLDVGNPGLTGILLVADGNGTGFLDSLFRTDGVGDLHVSLPTPSALLGFSLGFQVITFNSTPSAISLSNAVDVTFIP